MSRGRRTTRKAQQRTRLLDLATVAAPPFITIDGEDYDLVTRNTADLLTQHRAAAAAETLGESDIAAAVDAKDWAKAQAIMQRISDAQDEIVSLVVPTLPADVLARLSMTDKSAIVSAFTATASSQTPTPSPSSRLTGGNGSPDSNDSIKSETPSSG